ncbi:MAG: hypothetical protein WBE37_12660 [Bryobacteraceae bacterium]
MKIFNQRAIHSLGDEYVAGIHPEQRLQIRSGIEDDLLPRLAFPQSCLGQLLFGNIEAVTRDFQRIIGLVFHQTEFIVRPAILAALGTEAVVITVGAALQHSGQMAID